MTMIGLVRHGITDWNMEGRMQGRNDIPLNDEGRRQAELLGRRMAGEQWDMIYSSDLSRARETADIIAKHMGLKVQGTDSRLAERAFGLLEGTTEQDRLERWGDGWKTMDLGAEDKSAVVGRTLAILDELHHKHPEKRILVVSHGAVIGSLLETLFPEFGYIGLKNTCVNILRRLQASKWECLLHNCVKHLEPGTGTAVSLQAGHPKLYTHEGRQWTTALYKSRLEGPSRLGRLGFETDAQADLEHHGGPDKAVCVYCIEHYPYWEGILGQELGYGGFGENVTLSGLTEKEVFIGDTFRLGEAVVQISQPRQPCYKLGYRYGRADMPLLVQQAGYTGWYFRVLQEGHVAPGDTLERTVRSPHGLSVEDANRIMYSEKYNRKEIAALLAVPELSDSWRTVLQKRMNTLSDL